ncbi:MAG: elongation factor EF-2 [Candidatus Woesearchaeota archaeon]
MAKMIDRIKKTMDKQEYIRNIAICAHIDHGKTTFSDNLLAGAGMMSDELAGKACQLDFHSDEQERGITIDSASVNMVHTYKEKDFLVNLIDTPGHVDFGGDVTRAMRAVDGAIVLCCASEGIMPQTETVLRQALKERVKPVLFINKVDRMIKELQLSPEQMQEKFVSIIKDVNKLIREISPDYGERWQVNVADGSVAFGSAFHNWAMSVPYMKENEISFKDIIDAYESGDHKPLAKRAPLHEVTLNMVIEHLPNPVKGQEYRIQKIWRGDADSVEGKSLVKCDSKGPLFFIVVKIVIDPQAGEIAFGRLFSGTMIKGTTVNLVNEKTKGRIQQVFTTNGAKREIVDNVPAGNIIAIAGLKTQVGETITTADDMTPFEEISHIFDPVITKAIEASRPSDLPKLVEVLRQVAKEDPTIVIEINEETGEHLLHGMGELHLEIIENRIKSEKNVEVKTSPPIVVYRETVTKEGEQAEGKTPNKHNKFYFVAEPLEPEIMKLVQRKELPEGRVKKKDDDLIQQLVNAGYDTKIANKVKNIYNGNLLIDQTRGQVHMHEVIELINDMFENVMNAGPLGNDPCFGVKIKLMDMKLHEDAIHRGPAQVYPAVRDGIRETIRTSKPVLYEPLQVLHIEAPQEYMGEISKLVSNKRGQLLEMNQEGIMVIAKAKMPVAEMFGWSSDLRSATGGRGQSSLIDQVFERLPDELQQKTLEQIRQRKGLTKAMMGE